MTPAVALVAAAGSSARMGFDKIRGPLAGVPLIVHTIQRLSLVSALQSIVLAVQPGREDEVAESIVKAYRLEKVTAIVAGGATRVHSVWNALEAIDAPPGVVAVHDGARPFVSPAAVEEVLAAALEHGGAVAARRVIPTIKRVGPNGLVRDTLHRGELWAAATPQAFRFKEFLAAYRDLWDSGMPVDTITDDAQILERVGGMVKMVECNPENIKLTTRLDWATAEWMIQTGRDGR